jgi:cell volume regulation protein A
MGFTWLLTVSAEAGNRAADLAAEISTDLAANATGTILPRGFFLVTGLLYILALGLHRLAGRLAIPSALPILALALLVNVLHNGLHRVSPGQVETLHTTSLALLLFYAGLNTDLERIRSRLSLALTLPTIGILFTGLLLGVLLWALGNTGLPFLPRGGLAAPLPFGVALLTATCLLPTDGSANEETAHQWGHRHPKNVQPVLAFEAALGSATAILCFGTVVTVFLAFEHGGPGEFRLGALQAVPGGLLQLLGHLLAGLAAGLLVGLIANRLIPVLVRLNEHLLILAISVAFVAYATGNMLGGGGLISVYTAGLVMANHPHARGPFGDEGLRQVLLPFNTTAEFTMLLLLGLLVHPLVMLRMLPLGLVLGLLLELLVRPLVVLLLGGVPREQRLERLLISAGGLRAAVPLALALALLEQVPRLRGVHPLEATDLAIELEALVAVAVITSLVLKGVVLPRLLQQRLATKPPLA